MIVVNTWAGEREIKILKKHKDFVQIKFLVSGIITNWTKEALENNTVYKEVPKNLFWMYNRKVINALRKLFTKG